MLGFNAGFEAANLLTGTIEFRDPRTLLRVEQQTRQTNHRIYVGHEIGGHAAGSFRPRVGVGLALHLRDFGVDVVVPDDVNRENEIRQNLRGSTEAAFGYDAALGAGVNIDILRR